MTCAPPPPGSSARPAVPFRPRTAQTPGTQALRRFSKIQPSAWQKHPPPCGEYSAVLGCGPRLFRGGAPWHLPGGSGGPVFSDRPGGTNTHEARTCHHPADAEPAGVFAAGQRAGGGARRAGAPADPGGIRFRGRGVPAGRRCGRRRGALRRLRLRRRYLRHHGGGL